MEAKEFDSIQNTRMCLLASPEAEPPPARLDEEAPKITLAFLESVATTGSLKEADELEPEKVATVALTVSTLIEDACAHCAGAESEHNASSSNTPGKPTVTAKNAEIYATPMLQLSNPLMQQMDVRAEQQAAAMDARKEMQHSLWEMQQVLLQAFSTQKEQHKQAFSTHEEEQKEERVEEQALFLQEQTQQLTQFHTQVPAEVTKALQDYFETIRAAGAARRRSGRSGTTE